MQVAGWRAWYTSGRIYDSRSTTWKALPKQGVLFVMLYMDQTTANGRRYREALYGCDYYWQDGDTFKNEDIVPNGVKPKTGALLPDAEFEQIVRTAFAVEEW